jgi:hypothetical protein
MRSGGEHEAVEADRAPVVELERVALDVEPAGAVPEAQLEAEGGDLLRRAQQDAFEPPGAGQELLRQRGTVVGQMGLGPDEHDGAGVTFGAQGLCRAQPRQGGADDGDGGTGVEHHGRR